MISNYTTRDLNPGSIFMKERVEKRVVMDARAVEMAVTDMAARIRAASDDDQFCIIGIQTGGIHIAQRLVKTMETVGIPRPDFGVLDITLYRDDIFMGLQQPVVRNTDIRFDLTGRNVLLVDDVLYTGRTIRAALDALVDFGRPRRIRLAVLVDRGLREYPIQADFVGRVINTDAEETVKVELAEMGFDRDRVVVYERNN